MTNKTKWCNKVQMHANGRRHSQKEAGPLPPSSLLLPPPPPSSELVMIMRLLRAPIPALYVRPDRTRAQYGIHACPHDALE